MIKFLVLLLTVAAATLLIVIHSRSHPQDLPWTRLDLAQPVGAFTGRKLTGLTDDAPRCRALLRRAGVRFTPLAPQGGGKGQCGFADGVRFDSGGARRIHYAPEGLATACPVAAALAVWEWEVVQKAALRHFGQPVTRIDHFGSYSCRRMYGRGTGMWSEHATADAIDVAGFRLADGTRISLLRDWHTTGAKSLFLHEVRDGACKLFATTLSPDYNAAHRDHLHLDQAERGALGWRACR
ncbi:MAG: extensin family protein [Sphingomonas bacterium]|nr:extensin family protein [Sphingomonas bacterium]MDB5683379.1 extensin family protein [Sphingomonas bacterium]MDB5718005.1 extensin family protein [Sphingomonas bacterium]